VNQGAECVNSFNDAGETSEPAQRQCDDVPRRRYRNRSKGALPPLQPLMLVFSYALFDVATIATIHFPTIRLSLAMSTIESC